MKKKKLNISNIIEKILVIVFTFLIIFSTYKIYVWKKSNHKNKVIKETLQNYINIDNNDKYNIDFKSLKEKNSDTVGYIKVNGTNIDYVVVKTTDNKYYLNHNFNKEKNIAGWIFADYKNKLDGTDKNMIIYGHNTADDSMFGTLKNTSESNWYLNKDNHKVMYIDENGTNFYEVFSTYKIDNEEYYITTEFSSDDEYQKYLDTIKKRSVYDYGIDVDVSDNILTLSSCANLGKKRVVLHAKKIVN